MNSGLGPRVKGFKEIQAEKQTRGGFRVEGAGGARGGQARAPKGVGQGGEGEVRGRPGQGSRVPEENVFRYQAHRGRYRPPCCGRRASDLGRRKRPPT